MSGVKLYARKFGSLSILLMLSLLVLAACGSTSNNTNAASSSNPNCHKVSLSQVNLGVIPAENATKVMDTTRPFADELSRQLCGVKVNLTVGTSYSATITAMSSQKVDVAWFGPFSYVLAADKYNAQAILRQLSVDGSDHYQSYIITTPKTGINSLQDLKGHSFSFVDPASTSGNLIPRFTMVKNGLNPDKDVKGIFSGSHDLSLLAVINGKADAGAVASDTFAELVKQGKVKESDVKIISKSDPIPNSPIAVRKELSQSDKDAIRDAFLAIKDKKLLEPMNAGGFRQDKDSTYDNLRDVARSLNLDLTKLK